MKLTPALQQGSFRRNKDVENNPTPPSCNPNIAVTVNITWSQLTFGLKEKCKRKSVFVFLYFSLVNVMPILGFCKAKLQ